jgi:putative FmdB family regulatory protein
MPIYVYECEECHDIWEEISEFRTTFPPCKNCGSNRTFKRLTASNFAIHGSVDVRTPQDMKNRLNYLYKQQEQHEGHAL